MFVSTGTPEFKEITRNVQKALKDLPGILFEEKGPILSVHYRNVPREFSMQIPHVVEEELRSWKGRWKTTSGKRVLEIRPSLDFDKGTAVKEILRGFPVQGTSAVLSGRRPDR